MGKRELKREKSVRDGGIDEGRKEDSIYIQ
jgi:hypothetical protein